MLRARKTPARSTPAAASRRNSVAASRDPPRSRGFVPRLPPPVSDGAVAANEQIGSPTSGRFARFAIGNDGSAIPGSAVVPTAFPPVLFPRWWEERGSLARRASRSSSAEPTDPPACPPPHRVVYPLPQRTNSNPASCGDLRDRQMAAGFSVCCMNCRAEFTVTRQRACLQKRRYSTMAWRYCWRCNAGKPCRSKTVAQFGNQTAVPGFFERPLISAWQKTNSVCPLLG